MTAPNSGQSEEGTSASLNALLSRALLLDLEVSHAGTILKVGALRGELAFMRAGNLSPQALSTDLVPLVSGAECLLGHNLMRHDLPVLREHAPNLPLFRLPVIDTLVLSPICFPENPYHRLVKDYKLVRESLNDPVADARQAAALFADEFQTLNGRIAAFLMCCTSFWRPRIRNQMDSRREWPFCSVLLARYCLPGRECWICAESLSLSGTARACRLTARCCRSSRRSSACQVEDDHAGSKGGKFVQLEGG